MTLEKQILYVLKLEKNSKLFSKIGDTQQDIHKRIAGYGFGKKVHLLAFNNSEDFEVVSFFHPNKGRKKFIEEETGLECCSEWNKLIDRNDIEAIVIATPPEYRFRYAKEALIHGKHLLLEKPVCLRCNEIEELQRIALTKNLIVGVNFEYRAVPLFLQAKEIIDFVRVKNNDPYRKYRNKLWKTESEFVWARNK